MVIKMAAPFAAKAKPKPTGKRAPMNTLRGSLEDSSNHLLRFTNSE